MKHKILFLMAVITAFVFLTASHESSAQDFFKEKIIRIVAGYPPGGGVDTEARLVARYLGKHIPGNPNVIVDNMPGAGGRIALSHVGSVAKQDGLTLIVLPSTPNIFQILDKNRKFDLTKMIYLRGSSEPGVTVIRDMTGVKSAADLAQVDPTNLDIPGRSAPDGSQMALRSALKLLGVEKGDKTSLGYSGTAKITAALLQGED